MDFFLSIFYPNVAYASLDSFIGNVNTKIINPLITLLFALAVAYFLWGLFQFIMDQANGEERATGKSHMLWGIIGMAIMMGVFSIIHIVLDTLNIDGVNPEQGTVTLPD